MYINTNLKPFLIPTEIAQSSASDLVDNRESIRLVNTRIVANWRRVSQTYISVYSSMKLLDTSKPSVVDVNISRLSSEFRVVVLMPARITINQDECIASLRDAEVSISDSSCTLALSALREIIEHLFAKMQSGVKPGLAMANTFAYLESHIVYEPK